MDRNIVIAVDANDAEVGYFDKLIAHQEGILHRAVSVFVFNSNKEWLIQRRALDKYHSGHLWSNTACSHPMKGEPTINSAQRRLREEMGLDLPLEPIFSFQYKAEFDNGLIENELDHIFIGYADDDPIPNPDEVSEYKWISQDDLELEIERNPSNFTAWFKLLVPKIKEYKR